MLKKSAILLIFSLLLVETLAAQSFYNKRYDRDFIASVGTGITSYFGELNNPNNIFGSKPNLNIGLQYFVTDNISLRTEVSWFQIKGDDKLADDKGRVDRNLSFHSNNFEWNVVGMFNFIKKGPRYYQRNRFNAYVFGGVGLLIFNPKADLNGSSYSLNNYQTEGVKYSTTSIVIPFGAGVKIMAGPFFNIGLEAGYRKTFTDYLDDVSTQYIDNNSFSDPIGKALADRRPEIGLPLKEAGSKRGNPDKKDGYMMVNVKVEYFLPHGVFSKKKKAKRYKKPKRRR